jgi:hypothetical protein
MCESAVPVTGCPWCSTTARRGGHPDPGPRAGRALPGAPPDHNVAPWLRGLRPPAGPRGSGRHRRHCRRPGLDQRRPMPGRWLVGRRPARPGLRSPARGGSRSPGHRRGRPVRGGGPGLDGRQRSGQRPGSGPPCSAWPSPATAANGGRNTWTSSRAGSGATSGWNKPPASSAATSHSSSPDYSRLLAICGRSWRTTRGQPPATVPAG